MRLSMQTGRIVQVAALGLALALTAAACSNSSSSSTAPASSAPAASPAASSPASSPASPAAGSSSAAVAAITANWEAFFNGKTPATKKVALLQNGDKYAAVIKSQAGSSLATAAGARVTGVVVNSPTSATVSYDITVNGATALANQTGTAVYEDGTWKVGDVSFCALLKLENSGTTPAVCKS